MYRLPFFLACILYFGLNAQNPHGESFGIDCQKCHNNDGWTLVLSEISWNHSETGFDLEGQHKVTTCMDCHKTLEFSDTDPNCVSCHSDVHQMTVGNDCVRCHDENSWLVNDIPQLHEQNGFPLEGSHALISCSDCHRGSNNLSFSRLGNECIDCHRDDYINTQEPNRLASGFGTDCIQCHQPFAQGWGGENFHLSFPLVQGHANVDCRQCHQAANYADVSSECISCHRKDFNGTSNPDHRSAGFTTDCILCHTLTPSWSPAEFNHNIFPLVQGHSNLDCRQCHQSTNYADVSSECVSCHLDDFNSASTPDHRASGFTTDCNLCHSLSAGWSPAGYNQHDANHFPIYSGKHQGEWSSCTECHTNSSNYSLFSCIDCHAHSNQSEMRDEHSGVGGYLFESNACYSCHPTGED